MIFTRPSFFAPSTDASSFEAAGAAPTVPFACTGVTVTTSGSDSIVSCNDTVTTPWGLSITSEVRSLAPGDLARVTFFVTYTADNATSLGHFYEGAYGISTAHVQSSAPTVAHNTLLGGGSLGASDVWSCNVGAPGTLNAGVAWVIEGSRFVANLPFHGGFTDASVLMSLDAAPMLEAGETIALAFFYIVEALQPAATGEPTKSPAIMAEFATFDGRLTRGLPADMQVGDWQPAAVPELTDPELTDAGPDSEAQLMMAGLAAALLGTGAALGLVRRRPALSARR